MPRIVVTHAVGNMDTWLAGGAERAAVLKDVCSGYRVYRLPNSNKIAVVMENPDMKNLPVVLSRPDSVKLQAKHTVVPPIEVYVEIEGAK